MSSTMSRVNAPHTPAELQAILSKIPTNQLRVHYYTASWCPPCRAIAPVFEQLSRKHTEVWFLKLDTDALGDAAKEAGISSIPSFHFWVGGKKVHAMVGADRAKLEEAVIKYKPSGALPGSGSLKSGTSVVAAMDTKSQDFGILGQQDITSMVHSGQLEALNQHPSHTVHNIFSANKGYLASEVDEQLMLMVPFNQNVRLHSIKLQAKDLDKAPRTLKMFANPTSMLDFDQAESMASTQDIELSAADYGKGGEALVPLRFVKFQRVTSLVVFVVDNLGGGEETRLDRMWFVGTPLETTRMEDLKKENE